MKLNTKTNFLFLLACLAAGAGFAASPDHFFDAVPPGDPTYSQLKQLEDSGLLPPGGSQAPLTRYEVAEKIWKAKQKYDAIVLAEADTDLPPSPPDESGTSELPPSPGGTVTAPSGTPARAVKAAPTAFPTPDYVKYPQWLAQAERNLKTLEQTYQLELDAVVQEKQALEDEIAQAENAQYALWKELKGPTSSPSISIHGLGRAFGISEQYYDFAGNLPNNPELVTLSSTGTGSETANPANRFLEDYLDLEPMGVITKQIHWDMIIRLATSGLPLNGIFVQSAPPLPNPPNFSGSPVTNVYNPNDLGYDQVTFRRIAVDFSPDFMTMNIGDFMEAYTPFTLWNRDNLDLYYKPEPLDRWDDEAKYESFFNQEPDWPFRGIRMGTALGWPDSDLVDQFKVSVFGDMIRNGIQDSWWLFPSNASTFSNDYPDLILGGTSELKSKKWYTDDVSWQFTMDIYGVSLIELAYPYQDGGINNSAGTAPPASYPSYAVYGFYIPSSWSHDYYIGSIRPELKAGLGEDIYTGIDYEGAFAEYQDDKFDAARKISDYAISLKPFFQFGDSKVSFNYMNVGPYFYSPLAQTRQDDLAPGDMSSPMTALSGMGLFAAPLRSQFFLVDVPRPGEIYGFYDRTQDNVFPYGMGTPNREGVGLDFDIKALPKDSLKIAGAAYLVQEITGNIVVNAAGTTYVGLDPSPATGQVPVRKFTYLNVGPSFDLGPSIGLKTPLEIGANIRYENTNSIIGTLTDTWLLGGVKVGLFSWWEVAAAYGYQTMKGTDMGYDGTSYARYAYLFDNTDLGSYTPFTVNGNIRDLLLSTSFNIDRHSKLHFDYSLAQGTGLVDVGNLTNQYMEMTYEIKF
jgi:hypothetical protein